MKNVRDCAIARKRGARGAGLKVNLQSHESHREHAAFAEVEWPR
jgi:hypothetical protein